MMREMCCFISVRLSVVVEIAVKHKISSNSFTVSCNNVHAALCDVLYSGHTPSPQQTQNWGRAYKYNIIAATQ